MGNEDHAEGQDRLPKTIPMAEVYVQRINVPAVRKLRLGKVLRIEKDAAAAERTIHIETDVGDLRITLYADDHRDLAIEVLNPVTHV